MVVHGYHPQIGGSETHVRWLAEELARRRHLSPRVIAPREPGDPHTLAGIEIWTDPAAALSCDAVFTYTVSEMTLEVASRLQRATRRPPWLHHPCAVETHGFELITGADCIIAFNDRDEELTSILCGGSSHKVVRIRPGAHPERRGQPGCFRHRIGEDYILWVGAWEAAKGVDSLSRRFARLRELHPDRPLKLVMFGGYGGDQWPIRHPDIMTLHRNWKDVPHAIADSLFIAFNSPPPPLGHDASPLILLESFLNGKTFLAQAGTPILSEVQDLGIVVEDDEGWLRAAQVLLFDQERRRNLEQKCLHASDARYSFEVMVCEFETAVLDLLSASHLGLR